MVNYCGQNDTDRANFSIGTCVATVKDCGNCTTCPQTPYVCVQDMQDCCPKDRQWCASTQTCEYNWDVCCPMDKRIYCRDANYNKICANSTDDCGTCKYCPNSKICSPFDSSCCNDEFNGYYFCNDTQTCTFSEYCPCPPTGNTIRCPDGRCVANASQCNDNCKLCSNNQRKCTTDATLCCTGNTYYCPATDSCLDSTDWYGGKCPCLANEVRCTDGTCAASPSLCSGVCNVCFDGNCTEGTAPDSCCYRYEKMWCPLTQRCENYNFSCYCDDINPVWCLNTSTCVKSTADCTKCSFVCNSVCVSDIKECCYEGVWCDTQNACVPSLAYCSCDPAQGSVRCLNSTAQTTCVTDTTKCPYPCELCPEGSDVSKPVCVPHSDINGICCAPHTKWCPEYGYCINEYYACGTCQTPNVDCANNNYCVPNKTLCGYDCTICPNDGVTCVSSNSFPYGCCPNDQYYCDKSKQCKYYWESCDCPVNASIYCIADKKCAADPKQECSSCSVCPNDPSICVKSYPQDCCSNLYYCESSQNCTTSPKECRCLDSNSTRCYADGDNKCVDQPSKCAVNCTLCPNLNYLCVANLDQCCYSEQQWCYSSKTCEWPNNCCDPSKPIKCVNNINPATAKRDIFDIFDRASGSAPMCTNSSNLCGYNCTVCPNNNYCVDSSEYPDACCPGQTWCGSTQTCATSWNTCPCPSDLPIRCPDEMKCTNDSKQCKYSCQVCPDGSCRAEEWPWSCCQNDYYYCEATKSCIPGGASCTCTGSQIYCKATGKCVDHVSQCQNGSCALCPNNFCIDTHRWPNDCCPTGTTFCADEQTTCIPDMYNYFELCRCPVQKPIRCVATGACVANASDCGQCQLCQDDPHLCSPTLDGCCPHGMKWCATANQCITQASVCCPVNASIKCADDGKCVNNSASCSQYCSTCTNGLCIDPYNFEIGNINACCNDGYLDGFGTQTFYCPTLQRCIPYVASYECPCAPGQIRCADSGECVKNSTQCRTRCDVCDDKPNICVPAENLPGGCCSGRYYCPLSKSCIPNNQTCICPNNTILCASTGTCVATKNNCSDCNYLCPNKLLCASLKTVDSQNIATTCCKELEMLCPVTNTCVPRDDPFKRCPCPQATPYLCYPEVTCVANISQCPNHTQCPDNEMALVVDLSSCCLGRTYCPSEGLCVDSHGPFSACCGGEAPIKCMPEAMCVQNQTFCLNKTCRVCPNNHHCVAQFPEDCCPQGSYFCNLSNSCIFNSQSCSCPTGTVLCEAQQSCVPQGTNCSSNCSLCPGTNICRIGAPATCCNLSNGGPYYCDLTSSCKANATMCQCPQGTILCEADRNCKDSAGQCKTTCSLCPENSVCRVDPKTCCNNQTAGGSFYCNLTSSCTTNATSCKCPTGTVFCEANSVCKDNSAQCPTGCKVCNGTNICRVGAPATCCNNQTAEGSYFCDLTGSCTTNSTACKCPNGTVFCETERLCKAQASQCTNCSICANTTTCRVGAPATCCDNKLLAGTFYCDLQSQCVADQSSCVCPAKSPVLCEKEHTCVVNASSCPTSCGVCNGTSVCKTGYPQVCCSQGQTYCNLSASCISTAASCQCPANKPIFCASSGTCADSASSCNGSCVICPGTNTCQSSYQQCCQSAETWCNLTFSCISKSANCTCPANATIECVADGVCATSSSKCTTTCGVCPGQTKCVTAYPSACCTVPMTLCATTNSCVASLENCPCSLVTPIRCLGQAKCVADPSSCPENCALCYANKTICAKQQDDCCPSSQKWCDRTNTCVANFLQDCFCPTCNDNIGCTTDICNQNKTCTNIPVNSTCDDKKACTIDACDVSQGKCVNTPSNALCDDSRECTIDTCNGGDCTNTLKPNTVECVCTASQTDCTSPKNSEIIGESSFTAGLVKFSINAIGSSGNRKLVGGDTFVVSVYLSTLPNELHYPAINDNGDGTYSGSGNLIVAGIYNGTAKLGGFHIKGSPFSFRITSASTSASQCTIIGNGQSFATAGQNATFTVVARDAYGNARTSGGDSFLATIIGSSTLTLTPTDNNNGTYTFVYSLASAGTYVLVLATASGLPVASGNYTLTVVASDKTSASKSTATGALTGGIAGTIQTFTITARDANGNARTTGGDTFSVQLTKSDGRTQYSGTVVDNKDGTYSCQYNVTVAGEYKLRVTVYGADIEGSPYVAVISPAATTANSIAIVNKNDATAGDFFTFYIQAKDTYGNNQTASGDNFTVTPTYPNTNSPLYKDQQVIQITYAFGGLYTVKLLLIPYGTYTIAITLNGNAIQGSGFSLVLAPVATPTITKALFSDYGTSISVTFNKPTDKAGTTKNFNCANLISLATGITFGTNSDCNFANEQTLTINLQQDATINVGDKITILPNKLYVKYGNSLSVNGTVNVGNALNPVAPVAQITGPEVFGICGSNTLSGAQSKNPGRSFTFYWDVTPSNPSLAAITSSNSQDITIGPNDMDNGLTYTFSLTVSNFFGLSSYTTKNVYKSDAPIPTVQILNNPATVKSSDTFKLAGQANFPSCFSGNKAMKFSWTVVPSANVIPSDTSLIVPAGVLTAGKTYNFTFTGSMVVNSSISASSSISVTVQPSNPIASIQYGSRSVSIDDTLTLTSLSKDVDNSQSSLILEWSCMDVTQELNPEPCVSALDATTLQLPSTSSFSLDPGTLGLGTYQFSLQATVNATGLSGSTTATIYIKSGAPPSVFITNPSTKKQSPSDKISLLGNATTARSNAVLKYYWTCSTSNFEFNQNTTATGRTSQNLVIKPFALLGGVTYRFRLTATDIEAQIDGFNEYEITPNGPPIPGTLSITPTAGYSSNTSFTLSADLWSDSDGDLTYQFYYTINSTTGINYLTGNQPAASVPVTFPLAGIMTVYVRVYDKYSAYTELKLNTTVTVDKYIPPDATEFINGLIDDIQALLDAGDKANAKIKITNLAKVINDPDTPLTSDARSAYAGTVFDLLKASQDSVVTAESASLQMQAVAELAKSGALSADAQQDAINYITGAMQNLTEPLPQSAVDDTISLFSSILGSNDTAALAQQLWNTMNDVVKNQLEQLACGEEAASSSSDNVAFSTQKPSGDDLSSGSFGLPGTLSSFLFKQNITADCLSLQTVSWATDLSSGGSRKRGTQTTTGTRSGTVFSVVISGSDFSNVPDGILITIQLDPNSPAIDESNQQYACSYREDLNEDWTQDSTCTLVSYTDHAVVCLCTHLTEFTVFTVENEQDTPTDKPQEASSSGSFSLAVVIVPVIVGVVVITIVALIVYRKKRIPLNRVNPDNM